MSEQLPRPEPVYMRPNIKQVMAEALAKHVIVEEVSDK